MNSLPPESPKEEMVFLKLQRWVTKSIPDPDEQGHEEIFPSDEISFACSSINVCIIISF